MNQKTFAKNLSKLQKSTESLSVELMRLNKRVVSLTNKTIDLVNLLATELETGNTGENSPISRYSDKSKNETIC